MTTRNFQRYILSMQYNGKLFSGSSGHPSTMGSCRASLPSVQEVVESALHKFVDNSNFSDVQLSSRTDSGVHAFGNTLHVDIENKRRKKNEVVAPHDPVTVQRALNSMLAPKGIGITSVSAVPPTFHARFDAKHRTYMYRLLVLPKNPGWRNCLFDLNNSWIVSPRRSTYLNVDVMRAAARPLRPRQGPAKLKHVGAPSSRGPI